MPVNDRFIVCDIFFPVEKKKRMECLLFSRTFVVVVALCLKKKKEKTEGILPFLFIFEPGDVLIGCRGSWFRPVLLGQTKRKGAYRLCLKMYTAACCIHARFQIIGRNCVPLLLLLLSLYLYR